MEEAPVAFSATLPLWLKLLAGAILGAIALYSVRRVVRRPSELPRWVDSRTYQRRDVIVPTAAAIAFFVALSLLALDVTHNGPATRAFDQPVHDWFVRYRISQLTPVVVVVTNLVSPFGSTVLAILLATAAAWKTRSWVPALIIFVGPSLAGLLVRLVKWLAPRTRPPLVDQVVLTLEPSFPSGHVAGAVSLYGCVVLVLLTGFFGPINPRARTASIVIAAALSLIVIATRLYLAVHWFTDVSASVLLAGVVVCGTLAGYRQFVRTRPAVG